MDGMSKNIVRGISSVCNVYTFFIATGMLIKEFAKSFLLIQVVNSLEICINKNIILDIIKCIQVNLIYSFTSFNTLNKTRLIRWMIREIDSRAITGNKLIAIEIIGNRNSFCEVVK